MYSEQDTKIFQFTANGQARWVDPRMASEALSVIPNSDLEADWKLLQLKIPASIPALDRLVHAARFAFNLPQYDPETREGLLDSEAFEVFAAFNRYNLDVKKNTKETQSLPESTEPQSSDGEPVLPTMKPCTDCG